jgi:protein ImuB
VGCAVLEDSHAPEAFRIEPFMLPSGDSTAKTPLRSRPAARQIRPPETVSVTFRNGSLETFFFRGRRYAIERSYGPWLLGGEWWNQALWGHEQWDLVARAQNGAVQDGSVLCCCLVRDLVKGSWQMAAFYD